jgi:hypothetical protein
LPFFAGYFLLFTCPILVRQALDEISQNGDNDSDNYGMTKDLPGFFPVFQSEFRLHCGLGFAHLGSEVSIHQRGRFINASLPHLDPSSYSQIYS